MKKGYTYKSVEAFVFGKLAPAGYEIHQIPGSLVDNYICIAPDERHWNFTFREEYINEWASCLIKRKCRKLPKWAEAMLKEEDARSCGC